MPPPEPPKPLKTYPRPLPSPAHSLPSTAQFPHERYHSGPASSHMPPPLTTNLHCYPRSNPSNPALSSPSSTSSPAVESTPPPSTPGLNGSRIQLSEEGTITQDMISSVGSDRNENTPQARPRPFVRPQPQPNPRRYSSSGSRPATVRRASICHISAMLTYCRAVPHRLYAGFVHAHPSTCLPLKPDGQGQCACHH